MGRVSRKPCRVLVFNPLKRLVGIFQSVGATAKAFGVYSQSIHYACNGTCVSCKGLYFRQLSDDIEISFEDLGTLKLEEYDQLCGVERKVYKTKKMSRIGSKYKKRTNK